MAIAGAERIGELAASLMDTLDATEPGDELHSPALGTIALVVEVNSEGVADDHPGATDVFYRCSDQRRWVQIGFFEAAQRAVLEGGST